MLEIEQKFSVADLEKIKGSIVSLFEIESSTIVRQHDTYFSHPNRDFIESDEALRVRRATIEGSGNESSILITYKGPRIDTTGRGREFKTRREIELAVGSRPEDADKLEDLLSLLGFEPVCSVTKRRQHLITRWREWQVDFALDEVQDLGKFAEIEIFSGDDKTEAAQQAIKEMTQLLGLTDPITKSYRNMLFA